MSAFNHKFAREQVTRGGPFAERSYRRQAVAGGGAVT